MARGAGPRAGAGDLRRLFIAAPVPEAAADAVRALVADVQAQVDARASEPRSPVRWVRLDGLHLTLRFLGPTQDDRVAEVAAAVDRAVVGRSPFPVAIRGTGAFPSIARPRTVWLGVSDDDRALAGLASAVQRELAAAGWAPDERPFRGHLTLARADGRREGRLAAEVLAERAGGLDVSCEVDRAVLFESVTGRGAARYVALHEALLDR